MPFVENAARAWYANAVASQAARDTIIRDCHNELHDALLAIGLVEVADTGRMADPDTLSVPLPNSITTNTYFFVGWKMYRFDDALQASRPIYIKVGYYGWSVSATAGAPAFIFEIGTSTDGAGNLGGYRFGSHNYCLGAQTTVTNWDAAKLKAVGSTALGGFAILIGESANQAHQLLCIERLRDEAGDPSDGGIYIHSSMNATTVTFSSHSNSVHRLTGAHTGVAARDNYSTGNANTAAPAICAPENSVWPGGANDGNNTVFPHFPFTYKPYPPSLCFMGCNGSDLGADVVVPVDRYGVSRSYKNVGNSNIAFSGFSGGDVLMLTTPP